MSNESHPPDREYVAAPECQTEAGRRADLQSLFRQRGCFTNVSGQTIGRLLERMDTGSTTPASSSSRKAIRPPGLSWSWQAKWKSSRPFAMA